MRACVSRDEENDESFQFAERTNSSAHEVFCLHRISTPTASRSESLIAKDMASRTRTDLPAGGACLSIFFVWLDITCMNALRSAWAWPNRSWRLSN